MSNSIIPHLLSDSPPPIANNPDEDFDDEFGDFTGPGELSFDNDNFSTPPTPKTSKLYFTDSCPTYVLNSTEPNYETKNKEVNPVLNDITKELPPRNYINILDHIENNISKLDNFENDKHSETQKEGNREINDSVKVEPQKDLEVEKEDEIEINACDDTTSDLFKDTQSECTIKINRSIRDVNEETDVSEKLGKLCRNNDILSNSNFSYDKSNHLENFSLNQSGTSNSFETLSVVEKIDCDLNEKSNKDHNDNSVDEKLFSNLLEILNVSSIETGQEEREQSHHLNEKEKEDLTVPETNEINIAENSSKPEIQPLEYLDTNFEELGNSEVNEERRAPKVSEAGASEIDIFVMAKDGEICNENINEALTSLSAVNDDFGDFSCFQSEHFNLEKPIESRIDEISVDDDGFGNFQGLHNLDADFPEPSDCNIRKEESNNQTHETDANIDDDFDDFANYATFSQPKSYVTHNDNDDANKFSDCSTFNTSKVVSTVSADTESIKICTCPEEALKQAQCILENIFVATESNVEDYSSCDFTLDNSVFENLKDITETHALTYQWGKSSAQKRTLKTLNIDKRNILYGPNWNSGIPIFAANLCSTPLEPVKSDVPPPPSTPKKLAPPTQEPLSSDVAVTEFDWTSAGLTNPLDSLENADKRLDTSETIKTPFEASLSNQTCKSTSSDDFSNLSASSKDATVCLNVLEQKNLGMQETKTVEENVEPKDDFGDFASCQPKFEETRWINSMQPLRESHIFNQSTDIPQNSANNEVNEVKQFINVTTHLDSLEAKKEETRMECSDFEEFRSFSSASCVQNAKAASKTINEVNSSTSTPYEDIYLSTTTDKVEVSEMQDETEDEFTDFHSSSSSQSKNMVPTSNFHEPLQPAVLQPVPVSTQPVIQWPEPGLDEDEINRIVSGCLRNTSVNQKTNEVLAENNSKKASAIREKVSNNDDDEWTDFVSVKEPIKSRTSTPDLPLSVFNLGNIQPVKVPTPLVTPNGIISSPIKKPPNISTHRTHSNLIKSVQQTQHHPFITSEAFDSLYQSPKSTNKFDSSLNELSGQMKSSYNSSCDKKQVDFRGNHLEKNVYTESCNQSISYGNFQSFSSSVNKNSVEDDEWGDFVSASNVNSAPSLLQSDTRIITNPSHHMTSYNVKTTPQQYSLNSKSTIVRQERRNIPTISALPDLDFVTPKARNVKK